jgi:hypothetical protein
MSAEASKGAIPKPGPATDAGAPVALSGLVESTCPPAIPGTVEEGGAIAPEDVGEPALPAHRTRSDSLGSLSATGKEGMPGTGTPSSGAKPVAPASDGAETGTGGSGTIGARLGPATFGPNPPNPIADEGTATGAPRPISVPTAWPGSARNLLDAEPGKHLGARKHHAKRHAQKQLNQNQQQQFLMQAQEQMPR